MNPYHRLKVLTNYPSWHENPFHLSCPEMENPYLVIDEFFDMYNLPNLRISLKQWLDDTLLSGEPDVAMHMGTCLQVERLAEAAWVIHQQKTFESQKEEENPEDEEEMNDGPVRDPEETETTRRFVKRKFLSGWKKDDPVAFLYKAFKIIAPEELKKTIDNWQALALGNEIANYEKAGQRSDLLQFCNYLHKLTEAAFALVKITQNEQRSGINLKRPAGLAYDLLTREFDFQLSEEELREPGEVFKEFFSVFPIHYCRAELWDLLDSAITCNRLDKNGLLIKYECLLAITKIAWHLAKTEKKQTNNE